VILYILSLILFACALLSAWVTLRIVRDHLSTPGQRVAQIILVWVLPVLGAMAVLHMQRQYLEVASGKYREPPEPGDDFGMSGQSIRHFKEVVENDSHTSAGSETSD
jgi:hypothetical protein